MLANVAVRAARLDALPLELQVQRLLLLAERWRCFQTSDAVRLAFSFHEDQFRKTGEPYVSHPIAVATALLQCGCLDDTVLAGSLLHDVLEDCSDRVTPAELVDRYGVLPEVVGIVDILTKHRGQSRNDYYARIGQSPKAALIKLADRCHNLATMEGAFTAGKRAEYIQETADYVLPLCSSMSFALPQCRRPMRALRNRLLTQLASAKKLLVRDAQRTADLDYRGTGICPAGLGTNPGGQQA